MELPDSSCALNGGAVSASLHTLNPKRQPSLDALIALVANDMNGVNSVILDRMQSKVALIPELAGHLIAGGGKRMRPMLTLACANLLGYPGTRHHKLAAAVEFIHTATLLHDDVVDGSGMRRGKRTANLIWGNPASVLVGDFLFSRAFELMVEDGSLKVLRILSHASAVIAEGEVDQLTAQRQIDDRRGPLSRHHQRQDRRALSPPRAGSRRSSRRRARIVELALEAYGRNLGIAFQLTDDVIDYASDCGDHGQGRRRRFPRRQDDACRSSWPTRAATTKTATSGVGDGGERVSDDDLAQAIALLRSSDALCRYDRACAPIRPPRDRRSGQVPRRARPRRRWSKPRSSRSRALTDGLSYKWPPVPQARREFAIDSFGSFRAASRERARARTRRPASSGVWMSDLPIDAVLPDLLDALAEQPRHC